MKIHATSNLRGRNILHGVQFWSNKYSNKIQLTKKIGTIGKNISPEISLHVLKRQWHEIFSNRILSFISFFCKRDLVL
jgi:hypothetical protein